MNAKKKLLVVVLVLMMMFTAVAYAAWSDQIDVNGSVTTGEFDVKWETATPNPASIGQATASVERISNDEFSVSVVNAKPGDSFTFTLTAMNQGSVIANRQSVKLDGNEAANGTEKSYTFGTEDISTDVKVKLDYGQDTHILNPGASGNYIITVSIPSDSQNNSKNEGFLYEGDPEEIQFSVNVVYVQ